MMKNESLIIQIQHILPMPADKAILIAASFKERILQKNDFLLKEGQVCNESHFIEQGYLRSFTYDTTGKEVSTALYSPSMFANDFLSFFKRMPSQEHVQALTECKTWFISYEEVQANFHTIPEFREFGRMLLINNHAMLKQRMLSMIQKTAEQRYAHLMQNAPHVFQHVPLKIIASYLGITDSSLSRIRKDFR